MIIGLNGQKRSGKDTVCQIIQEFYPNAVRLAFADKIKESLAALFGLSVEEIENLKDDGYFIVGSIKYEKVLPWRTIVQRYGTEAHRDIFGYDFWLDAALPKEYIYDRKLIIVTDVRFPNEAQRISYNGGFNIEITRPELDNKDSHISEKRLPSDWIDATICNDGSLEELKEKVLENIIKPLIWFDNDYLVNYEQK